MPERICGLIDFQLHVAAASKYSQPHLCVTRTVTVLSERDRSVTVPRKQYDGRIAAAGGRQQAQRASRRKRMMSVRCGFIETSPPD
ncbi:MAG: hypothetical protein A4E36_00773 [Methanoregulaceae archaeon PtaB.Bin009]|nr:MAG: hypothetical protein A4E36_00773 [Methanoregulaceae archaeon PtaB.Bin009]OPY39470.1 MAG: hypothetical protein A4E41_01704 [Methanoregulaceae archaeon PtaU1.Bin066]